MKSLCNLDRESHDACFLQMMHSYGPTMYMNQCVSNVPYVAAKKLIDVMFLRMSMNPKCEYQPV